jgi:glucan phosphoethanolaminetransferase (alkaline phosphatase superfamily)
MMSKLFWSLLWFGICLQIAAYLAWAYDFFGGTMACPITTDAANVLGVFTITPYTVMFAGAGAAAIGLGAIVTRSGTYALYAVMIWAIGCFITNVSGFFLAIPNTIGALIPAVTNPNPAAFPIHPLISALAVFAAVALWCTLFGFAMQREV